jgi:hypothetical protein
MSITTWGFGSLGGLVTTLGWGGLGAITPPTPAIPIPPLCPEIVDSLELAPKLTGSGLSQEAPVIRDTKPLRPTLAGSDKAEESPTIRSSEKLVPKIKDSKGPC